MEVFTSIQGEGLYAGRMHRFIRFAGCNLACGYCDTPASREPDRGEEYTLEALRRAVAADDAPYEALCLTGGEPLLQAGFIKEFLIANRRKPFVTVPILLETNGTLPEELELVLPYVDVISMDIKTPDGACPDLFETQRRFALIAYLRRLYVKLVVTPDIKDSDFDRAVGLVAGIDAAIPFYIQPVTPYDKIGQRPSSERLIDLYVRARRRLESVAVMPQLHTILGLR